MSFADNVNGTASIEWIAPESRVGAVLDPQGESSWFIVLRDGAFSASGYLYKAE